MDFGSDSFLEYESAGMKEVGAAAFVLVAGGLGERLGYSGEMGVLGLKGSGTSTGYRV